MFLALPHFVQNFFDQNFLTKSLNDLFDIFVSVCEKKSSSAKNKSDFESKKNSIIECFEQSETRRNILTDAQHDSTNLQQGFNVVLSKLESFRTEINSRMSNLEKKVLDATPDSESSVNSHSVSGLNYADALNRNTAPVPVANFSSPNIVPNFNQHNSRSIQIQDQNIGFQERNKTPMIVGKRKETALRAVVTEKRRRILVNKFHPDTTAKDITDLISKLTFAYECVKIDTRNKDIYASFVLASSEDNMGSLCDPDLWPDGINILDFRGFPRRLIDKSISVSAQD